MRVLHICQRDDPDIGGSLRVVEGLVREQRKAGIDAWLLFLYGPSSTVSAEFAPNIVCLKLGSSKQALSGIRLLGKALKRIAPDIIHSHDGILWPRFVYCMTKIPVVTHAHLPPSNTSGIKNRLGWPLIKRSSDAVIGISGHTMDAWISAGYPSHQIFLIPNGVDFSRFPGSDAREKAAMRSRLNLPAEGRIMLWVGRLHREMKGTDRVEKVAKHLPPDVVLVVVGNGPEFDGMKIRMAPLIKEKKVVMAGSVSKPERYYQAADAYLFTSYFEPFGLVILEAVASALPILAFPVRDGGGAIDLLKIFDAEEISDGASGDDINGAVECTLNKRSRGPVLRESAMQKYSWEAASRQVAGIYEQLRGGQ
jgi:glycosyltransferase involved in cell wall biosynthesis